MSIDTLVPSLMPMEGGDVRQQSSPLPGSPMRASPLPGSPSMWRGSRTSSRRSSLSDSVPSRPMFSAEHYLQPQLDSPSQTRHAIRRRPRSRRSTAPADDCDSVSTASTCTTDDSSTTSMSPPPPSHRCDGNNNVDDVDDKNHSDGDDKAGDNVVNERLRGDDTVVAVRSNNSTSNRVVSVAVENSNGVTRNSTINGGDKKSYSSEQFREEAERLRHRIRHPKSTAQLVSVDQLTNGKVGDTSSGSNSDTATEETSCDSGISGDSSGTSGAVVLRQTNGDVEIPVGATELQKRLITSKVYQEKTLAQKLDEKIVETDNLIQGLKESQQKKTTRDKVVSATREVQNAVKPQIVRDPVTCLRSYKVNLNMGQFKHNVTHVVKNREVTVIGQTDEEPRFTKEMKVQFPIDVNMETLNVEVEDEVVVVDVAFQRWKAKSTFIGHKDRTPETLTSIRNVFLGKGSLADAPLYKPKPKKEFLMSRGYGSTYSTR